MMKHLRDIIYVMGNGRLRELNRHNFYGDKNNWVWLWLGASAMRRSWTHASWDFHRRDWSSGRVSKVSAYPLVSEKEILQKIESPGDCGIMGLGCLAGVAFSQNLQSIIGLGDSQSHWNWNTVQTLLGQQWGILNNGFCVWFGHV